MREAAALRRLQESVSDSRGTRSRSLSIDLSLMLTLMTLTHTFVSANACSHTLK